MCSYHPTKGNIKGKYMTILNKAMNMPGVRVNRENYLRINLSKYVPDEQVEKAIETTPASWN
jgi:hypothetical protein